MRVRGALIVLGCLAMAAGGCGSGSGPATSPPTSTAPVPTAPTEARAQLAALAAVAKDRRLTAFYTLRTQGRPDRTVAVTLATDGSWRVDVPGGAHGGGVDIAMVSVRDGIYQCVIPTALAPGSCVRVAPAGGTVPAAVDPRVQYPFTDWREIFTDRRAPLSVAPAARPAGAGGACYSVELTLASMAAPVDPGVYCYAPDGTLTGAATGFGVLVPASSPGPAPPTVPLPATIVSAPALPVATPSGSPSPTRP